MQVPCLSRPAAGGHLPKFIASHAAACFPLPWVRSIVSYILLRHLPAGTRVTGHAGALDVALQRRHSSLDADVRAARLCEAAAERLRCARCRLSLLLLL